MDKYERLLFLIVVCFGCAYLVSDAGASLDWSIITFFAMFAVGVALLLPRVRGRRVRK